MSHARQLIHATAIAVDGRAALIIGPSGSGKSDLALRLVMTPFHDGGRTLLAHLIADDQVVVQRHADKLIARAPDVIAGRIEVRGLGILPFDHVDGIAIALVADIDPARPPDRFPEPPLQYNILGLDVPMVRFDALHAAAPAKLVLALLRLGRL